MSGVKRTLLAASGVTLAVFLSKLLGFVREMYVAKYFGTSMQTDAYEIAATLPLFVFNLVFLNAIIPVVVPLYTELKQNKGSEEGIKFVNNLAGLGILISIMVVVTGLLIKHPLVKLIAPGFSAYKHQLTVELLTIMFPMIILSAVTGIGVGLLNANRTFWLASLVGVPQNVIIIAVLICFGNEYGIHALAYGTLLSVFGQFTLIIVPSVLRYNLRPKIFPSFNDNVLRKSLIMALPVLFNTAVSYTGLAVDRIMASGLSDGSISALNYAFKLTMFVEGIFVAAISIVSLQSFSEYISKNDYSGLNNAISENIRLIGAIVIPMVVGLITLRHSIVTVLFKAGAFDDSSVYKTTIALGFYSLGLIGIGIRDVVNNGFYAMKDSKTPAINSFAAVMLNIILNLVLVKRMGLGGLALSTSVSITVMSILLIRKLRRSLGVTGGYMIILTYAKCGIAAAVMGVFAWLVNSGLKLFLHGRAGEAVNLTLTVLLSVLLYFIAAYMLKIDEVVKFVSFVCRKPTRRNKEITAGPVGD